MADQASLIYQKSNTYRLHADIVRWALLGGYGAFFGATIRLADDAGMGFVLFLTTVAFLMVMAVQNWFYNLFADFVGECESRIAKGDDLRPLREFAQAEAPTVTPFHPAFFFALLIVALGGTAYLQRAFSWCIWECVTFGVVMLLVVWLWFRKWNSLVYPFLKKTSNLFSPVSAESEPKAPNK